MKNFILDLYEKVQEVDPLAFYCSAGTRSCKKEANVRQQQHLSTMNDHVKSKQEN
jgi:hypothetical protein